MAQRRPRLGCLGMVLIFLVVCAAVAWWRVLIPLAAVALGAYLVLLRRRRHRLLVGATTLADLCNMHPERFEQQVAAILSAMGWRNVQWVGRTGDNGADVIGMDTVGRRTVVQVKRYQPSARVGSPVIQQTIGAMAIHRCDRAMVVTTAGFTPAAMQLASQMDVELWNGAVLVEMAQRARAIEAA